MPKETGIIMSGDHPKLILDGLKTQTRRVIKPQPNDVFGGIPFQIGQTPKGKFKDIQIKCPYGQAGERLWVKEKHYLYSTEQTPKGIIYYADTGEYEQGNAIWRPSIFLPRWASRILLEITGIKVDRIDQISYEDAKAEGCISISDFAILWDSLNAKRGYSWSSNPWVWAIRFTLIKAGEEEIPC